MTGPKPTGITVTKKECATKDLDGATKLFVPPAEIKADAEVSFFCIADDCNKEKEIKDILKEDDGPKTLAAMTKVNKAHEKKKTDTAGAAQTTVAVATIAFSMVMARLAL